MLPNCILHIQLRTTVCNSRIYYLISIVIPADIIGKQVKHKAFGVGMITAIEGTSIAVEFDKVGLKKMGYEFCMEKKMLEFI